MKQLRAGYVIFTHAVILLLLVVTGTHLALAWRHHRQVTTIWQRLPEIVRHNYAHMSEPDVADLLRSTQTMRYRFAPWIGIRERPTTSRFVNVNEYGIRSNGRPMASLTELDGAIWVFGGSTTFGYGVADTETIPARLETALGRPVMNFGVAAAFSAQENLRLMQVMRYGLRPSRVIFLDGINEACQVVDDHRADPRFEDLLDHYRWEPLEIVRPVLYVVWKLRDLAAGFLGRMPASPEGDKLVCSEPRGPQPIRVVHARMMAERELLCRLYALECTTFVQPFPGLHARHDDPTTLPPADRRWLQDLFAQLEGNWRDSNAVFVTDVLAQQPHPFVDGMHYSQAANTLIAQAMANRLPAPSPARTPATTAGQ